MIGLAIPIYRFPELPFYSEPYIDLFAYTFNILNYAEAQFDMRWYFDDRITAIIPSVVFYKAFEFEIARWINFLFYYLLFSFSLFKALRSFFTKKVSYLLFSLYIANPILMGNLSNDYTALKAEIFLYLSVFFIARCYKSTKTFSDIFWGGLFFAFSFIANMKIILYGSFLFVFPLYYFKNWKDFGKESVLFILSFILAFPLLGAFNTLVFNGDFWFYRDSINNIHADIKYGGDIFSYFDAVHAGFNPASFLSFICVFCLGLNFKINWRKALFPLAPILSIALYHFAGGSIFIHTSIGWYFFPLFLCFWPIIEKFNLEKINIGVIFILFIILCYIQFHSFDIRGRFAYYWPFYFKYIVLISIPALFYIYKKRLNYLFLSWLLIIFLLIKPFGFARYAFGHPEFNKEKMMQMYEGYKSLKREFGIDKIQFFVDEKDHEHSLIGGIAFLTVGVSTRKVAYYDKVPPDLDEFVVISNTQNSKRDELLKILKQKGYRFFKNFTDSVILKRTSKAFE